MKIIWITLIILIILITQTIRIRKRGWFWKDKNGIKIGVKDFFKRWKKGVANLTPLQQTITTLWSFLPIFGGMLWGIVITAIVGSYWLTLILCGSLPITSIQFISNYQKYKSLKKIDEIMSQAK